MNHAIRKFPGGRGIGLQLLSILLLIFFSVVLVNALDFDFIQKSQKIILGRFGALSSLLFLFITAILYALAFPSTVLGAASGATLGIFSGILFYVPAAFLASVIVYLFSRTFLHNQLHHLIRKNEYLASAEKVVKNEGLRFLFLVRFIPVHATFISALFGIVDIKPARFLISFIFLLPELILHVYVGYVTATMPWLEHGREWEISDIIRLGSLLIGIGGVIYLGWLSERIIKRTV